MEDTQGRATHWAVQRADWLATLAPTLFALRYLLGSVWLGVAGVFSALVFAWLRSQMVRRLAREYPLPSALFVAVCVGALINGAEYDWRPLYYAALGGSSVLVAYALSQSAADALRVSRFLLLGFFVVIFALMPLKGITPADFNAYFPASSRNGISANLIFLQVFYSATYYVRHNRAPLLTALLTFGLCVLLYGRSGTTLSASIVLASCASNLRLAPMRSIAAGAFVIVAMAFITAPALPRIFPDTFSEPPLAIEAIVLPPASPGDTGTEPKPVISEWRLGVHSIRPTMIVEYLLSLSVIDVVLGGELGASPTISEYNLNPHNAFIRGHAYFGLAYIALIASLLVVGAIEAIRSRTWLIFALMSIFATRAFLDAFALFDLFDVGFFYCYFLLTRPLAQQSEPRTQPQ